MAYTSNGKIIHRDCMEEMAEWEDESVHLTFTSPPYYNARDYSQYESYREYLDFLEDVFFEIHRITKEGRFLIVNTSPVIEPRESRQHQSKRYGIPFDLHPRIVSSGWDFIDDILWVKPEPSVPNRVSGFNQHRKPLTYKPNACVEYLMVYRKGTSKLIDWNLRQYPDELTEMSLIKGDIERSNVWNIAPASDKLHSAVFPLELCNRVLRYYSFMADIVLDPFAGSGTVGVSALQTGRRYLLIEQNKEYIDRIYERIGEELCQLPQL